MKKLIVIAGTNASGKSGLGIELARHYNGEIISADSRQVFKGLDLGSGKVTQEEMKGVPHHLLDIALPGDFFSLSHFQKLAYDAIDDTITKGRQPFLVGGTGLYVNSIIDGYNLTDDKPDMQLRAQVESRTIEELIEIIRNGNPSALEKLDLKNKRRLERTAEKVLSGNAYDIPNTPRYETLVIGVTWPREILYERIRIRLDKRLKEGMIEEVERIRALGKAAETSVTSAEVPAEASCFDSSKTISCCPHRNPLTQVPAEASCFDSSKTIDDANPVIFPKGLTDAVPAVSPGAFADTSSAAFSGIISDAAPAVSQEIPIDDFLYKLGLEYRYILMYLRGDFPDYQAFYDKLFMEIRHLAKEQMTWFRKRNDIHWLDMEKEPFEEACAIIDQFLNQ